MKSILTEFFITSFVYVLIRVAFEGWAWVKRLLSTVHVLDFLATVALFIFLVHVISIGLVGTLVPGRPCRDTRPGPLYFYILYGVLTLG